MSSDPLEEFLDPRLQKQAKSKFQPIYVRFTPEERAEVEDCAWLLNEITFASGKKPTRNTAALGSIAKRFVLREVRRLFEIYGGRPTTPEQKAEARERLAKRFGASAADAVLGKKRTKTHKK